MPTSTTYNVLVNYKGWPLLPDSTYTYEGFTSRDNTEKFLIALASRPEVLSAKIVTVEGA